MKSENTKWRSFSVGVYLNICLIIVYTIAGAFLIKTIKTQGQEQALWEAQEKAQLILDRNLATHSYFSHTLKPKLFKFTEPIRDDDYFDPSWMSSTFAVREIDNNFKSLNNEKYYYKECAANARSPQNEADEFERDFIKELNTNPELKYRSLVRKLNGDYYYVTLRRGEVMATTCLRCHSTPDNAPKNLITTYGAQRSFNRRANEVISAISIRVPLSAAYAKGERFSKHLSELLVVVLLIIFAAQYIIYRFLILAPITTLKNQALTLSKDEQMLGEKVALPISREFGDLAFAFNTMSLKLRHQFDKLEEMVEERTSELENSNQELRKTLTEVKTLRGIIPICMYCKEIRDDKGAWNKLEKYISENSEAQFSHGICDKCLEKHTPHG